MHDGYQTREGYLLIADISGYTNFLTSTELAHAQAIVHELTSLVREHLVPPMHFVKLEGDAVFCYADGPAFRDGERFLELIEVCYVDYSNRLLNMARNTTCPCSACAAIGSLDLKFVCHYGNFIVESEGGRVDLAGPDVILVHRLLKNSVSERTGIEAYALFTQACLRRLPQSFQLPPHEEVYESFGVTAGGVHDLKQSASAIQDAHRHYIGAEDADLVLTVDVPVPPAVAWKYWVDPVERQRWQCRHFSDEPDRVTPNTRGRVGPGTWRWEFVDWRPFTTFTCEVSGSRIGRYLGLRDEFDTFEFTPTKDGGTHVDHRIRLKNRGRLSLSTHRLQSGAIAAAWRRWHSNLQAAIAEDTNSQPHGSPSGLNLSIRRDT
ncbi:hypothetical protein BVU76_27340 [Mycolicibacterium porcinum]|nr:hypothetical protein BVU76_27340 [Mycolicibacterium porcinum]